MQVSNISDETVTKQSCNVRQSGRDGGPLYVGYSCPVEIAGSRAACADHLRAKIATLFVACATSTGPACRRPADPRPLSSDTRDPAEAKTPAAAADGDAEEDAERDGASPAPPIPPAPLFTNLDVPGFPSPVVSLPNGATSKRPLLVALHGSGDRPDYNCDAWRHVTGARGFILCPRGDYDPRESTKNDARYTLRGGAPLRHYIDAAMAALETRFAGYVDTDRPVVAGFSLGATEIAQVALLDAKRFPRVAVVEGGHGVWNDEGARRFGAEGGLRVLVGCGSPWCQAPARDAVGRLTKAGVPARAVHAKVGHTIDRPLQEALMDEIPWFLEGDPRWASSPPG